MSLFSSIFIEQDTFKLLFSANTSFFKMQSVAIRRHYRQSQLLQWEQQKGKMGQMFVPLEIRGSDSVECWVSESLQGGKNRGWTSVRRKKKEIKEKKIKRENPMCNVIWNIWDLLLWFHETSTRSCLPLLTNWQCWDFILIALMVTLANSFFQKQHDLLKA